jgi:hypothetical protein
MHLINHNTITLLSFIREIVLRPAMYAPSPQAAHGMIEALASVILSHYLQESLRGSLMRVEKCLRYQIFACSEYSCMPVMLCDDEYTKYPIRTYESTTAHASELCNILFQPIPEWDPIILEPLP